MSEINYYLEYVNEFVKANEADRKRLNSIYLYKGEQFDANQLNHGKNDDDIFDLYPEFQKNVTRKPVTIKLNGFDVVPPITDRLPREGQGIAVIDTDEEDCVNRILFESRVWTKKAIRFGWFEKESDAETFAQALFHPFKANYKGE